MLGDNRKKRISTEVILVDVLTICLMSGSNFRTETHLWQSALAVLYQNLVMPRSSCIRKEVSYETRVNWRPPETADGHHLPGIYVSACQLTPSPAPLTPDSSRWLGSSPNDWFMIQLTIRSLHITLLFDSSVTFHIKFIKRPHYTVCACGSGRQTHSWVCFLHCWPSSLCHWWLPPSHPVFLRR